MNPVDRYVRKVCASEIVFWAKIDGTHGSRHAWIEEDGEYRLLCPWRSNAKPAKARTARKVMAACKRCQTLIRPLDRIEDSPQTRFNIA